MRRRRLTAASAPRPGWPHSDMAPDAAATTAYPGHLLRPSAESRQRRMVRRSPSRRQDRRIGHRGGTTTVQGRLALARRAAAETVRPAATGGRGGPGHQDRTGPGRGASRGHHRELPRIKGTPTRTQSGESGALQVAETHASAAVASPGHARVGVPAPEAAAGRRPPRPRRCRRRCGPRRARPGSRRRLLQEVRRADAELDAHDAARLSRRAAKQAAAGPGRPVTTESSQHDLVRTPAEAMNTHAFAE
jgi:hypothetical protein